MPKREPVKVVGSGCEVLLNRREIRTNVAAARVRCSGMRFPPVYRCDRGLMIQAHSRKHPSCSLAATEPQRPDQCIQRVPESGCRYPLPAKSRTDHRPTEGDAIDLFSRKIIFEVTPHGAQLTPVEGIGDACRDLPAMIGIPHAAIHI